jgi:hypothetical protein
MKAVEKRLREELAKLQVGEIRRATRLLIFGAIVRLRPPGLAGGTMGSTTAHSAPLRSLG